MFGNPCHHGNQDPVKKRISRVRVVATVGGAGRGRPALTISARHNPKKNDFRPAQFFFYFFLVPGTMFHNRGSIIAQYTYMLYTLKMTLSGSESPPGHCPWTPGRWRCASLASLTPLAIILHNYFPPLRLGWLQPCRECYCIRFKIINIALLTLQNQTNMLVISWYNWLWWLCCLNASIDRKNNYTYK